MTELANLEQRMGALFGFGRSLNDTPRGQAIARCLYLRGLRSWVTPGAYAWFRLNDDIRLAQKAAAALRDSDGTRSAETACPAPVPFRTAKRGPKASPRMEGHNG